MKNISKIYPTHELSPFHYSKHSRRNSNNIVIASQARIVNKYKNLKHKIPKCKVSILLLLWLLLLLLLLYDMDVSSHRPFLPGTSLEPAVIPSAQASSFTLQYFPYSM